MNMNTMNPRNALEIDSEIVSAIEQKMGTLVENITGTMKGELSSTMRNIMLKSVGYEHMAYTNKMKDEKRYHEQRMRDEKMIAEQRKQHNKATLAAEISALRTQKTILEQTKFMINKARYNAMKSGTDPKLVENLTMEFDNVTKSLKRNEDIRLQKVSTDAVAGGVYDKELHDIELKSHSSYNEVEARIMLSEFVASDELSKFDEVIENAHNYGISEEEFDAAYLEAKQEDESRYDRDNTTEAKLARLRSEAAELGDMKRARDREDEIANSAAEMESKNTPQKVDIIPTSLKGIGMAVGAAVLFAVSGAMKIGSAAQGVSNAAALYTTMNLDPTKAKQIDTAFANAGMNNTLGGMIGTLRQVMPDAGVSDLLGISNKYNSMDAGAGRDSYLKKMGFSADQGLAVSRFGEILSASNNIKFNEDDLAVQKAIAEEYKELQKALADISVNLVTTFSDEIVNMINAMKSFVEFVDDLLPNARAFVDDTKVVASFIAEDNETIAKYLPATLGGNLRNFLGGTILPNKDSIYSGVSHEELMITAGININGPITVIANDPEEFTNALKNETNHIRKGE